MTFDVLSGFTKLTLEADCMETESGGDPPLSPIIKWPHGDIFKTREGACGAESGDEDCVEEAGDEDWGKEAGDEDWGEEVGDEDCGEEAGDEDCWEEAGLELAA